MLQETAGITAGFVSIALFFCIRAVAPYIPECPKAWTSFPKYQKNACRLISVSSTCPPWHRYINALAPASFLMTPLFNLWLSAHVSTCSYRSLVNSSLASTTFAASGQTMRSLKYWWRSNQGCGERKQWNNPSLVLSHPCLVYEVHTHTAYKQPQDRTLASGEKKHIKHHAVAVVTVHSGSPDVLYKCISGVHGDMAHKLFHLQEDVFTLLLCLWEQL